MKKKTFLTLASLIILVVIAIVGYQSYTKQHTAHSGDDKTLRIATTGVSFPGSYKDGSKLTGFDVEVARAVGKKIGYKVKFTTTSFDGLFGLLTSDKVDAIASSVAITNERKQTYDFSTPYATFKYGIAVQKDAAYTNVEELQGKTIGATVGSNQINVVKEHFKDDVTIQTFDDREAVLQGLLKGQVDGYANAQTILSAVIQQKNLDLKVLDGDLGQENIALTFAKGKNKDLRKKVNAALADLEKDGTIARLSKKYFSGIDASYGNQK
ncbi:transporter substrate-binding domain-containing protein [Streptococcus dentasini]